MSEEIKGILNKFDKVLENYELDKKFKQFSVDSICHLFPNEMLTIKNTITSLQQKVEQLENIKKEAIEYIKKNKETREHYEPYGTPMGNSNYTTAHIFGYYELLDILNKGDNNVKDKK